MKLASNRLEQRGILHHSHIASTIRNRLCSPEAVLTRWSKVKWTNANNPELACRRYIGPISGAGVVYPTSGGGNVLGNSSNLHPVRMRIHIVARPE